MIILIVFLLFLGWILVSPIYILIDTTQTKYEAGILGLFNASLNFTKQKSILIRIKILFYSFNINPFKRSRSKGKKSVAKKKKKQKSAFTWFLLKIVWQILKRTKIKKFYLNIDTGDVIRNAFLIPKFVIINIGHWNFTVNYENKNELIIHIEHRLYIILWQFIVNFINYKFKNL